MTFTSDAEEVFYYLLGLDQKSDILNLLPMVWLSGITRERLNFGAGNQPSAIPMNVFAALTPFTTRMAHIWRIVILR